MKFIWRLDKKDEERSWGSTAVRKKWRMREQEAPQSKSDKSGFSTEQNSAACLCVTPVDNKTLQRHTSVL